MRQKLFLTSEGIQPELQNIFLTLLNKPVEETQVLFLTTAAYGEGDDVSWLENHRVRLRELGLNRIQDLDLRTVAQAELQNTLQKTDLIYINGGSASFFIKYARTSGFIDSIKDFLKNGGLYVGVSAGTYVACPTIEQAFWKDPDKEKFDLKDFTALNLVPFWIVAHFSEKWKKSIETAARKTKHPVIALNDKQAILVVGEEWRIVGAGKQITFNLPEQHIG